LGFPQRTTHDHKSLSASAHQLPKPLNSAAPEAERVPLPLAYSFMARRLFAFGTFTSNGNMKPNVEFGPGLGEHRGFPGEPGPLFRRGFRTAGVGAVIRGRIDVVHGAQSSDGRSRVPGEPT
jgi:hypothetical protein